MCYIMTCSISKVLLLIFFMWYNTFSQLFSCFCKFVTGNMLPLALWILLDEEITHGLSKMSQLELLQVHSKHTNWFYYFQLHVSNWKAIISWTQKWKNTCTHFSFPYKPLLQFEFIITLWIQHCLISWI